MVNAKESLVNIAICRICEANGDVGNAENTSFVVLILSFRCVSFFFSGNMRSPRVLLQLIIYEVYVQGLRMGTGFE